MAFPCTERYAAFNLAKQSKICQKYTSQYASNQLFITHVKKKKEGKITYQHRALPEDHTTPPFVPW
jgi:hypothetical protein